MRTRSRINRASSYRQLMSLHSSTFSLHVSGLTPQDRTNCEQTTSFVVSAYACLDPFLGYTGGITNKNARRQFPPLHGSSLVLSSTANFVLQPRVQWSTCHFGDNTARGRFREAVQQRPWSLGQLGHFRCAHDEHAPFIQSLACLCVPYYYSASMGSVYISLQPPP